jgi:hypothetical protein
LPRTLRRINEYGKAPVKLPLQLPCVSAQNGQIAGFELRLKDSRVGASSPRAQIEKRIEMKPLGRAPTDAPSIRLESGTVRFNARTSAYAPPPSQPLSNRGHPLQR